MSALRTYDEHTIYLKRPHPAQARFIRSRAKRKVAKAGRRGGKTTGVSILAVQCFLAGQRVLYAVPTAEQINRFWREVTLALREPIDVGVFKKNETEHTIELSHTEQRIKAKTAWNADTLRGDYADLLILDEFQLMHEETWGIVGAPMLLDNDGDAVFAYTPPSLRNAGSSKARDPRHATKFYREAAQDRSGRWETFHFTSHDNPHLSKAALREIAQDMTALAIRQEILAEEIDDAPGALWTRELLNATRVITAPPLTRIVIGVDPAAGLLTETGIVAAGIGRNGHGYVAHDESLAGSPHIWGEQAVALFGKLKADRVCGEVNNGGEMVGYTIQTEAQQAGIVVAYKKLHASRGKAARAEPVAALYEQQRVHHVGTFPKLEDELCQWEPGSNQASPNRLDACLVAGTMIATSRGRVPIEQVTTLDSVWTRGGWQQVLQSEKTACEASVMTVEFSNGAVVVGTGDHPVFVHGKGWMPLETLEGDDAILVGVPVNPLTTGAITRGGSQVPPVVMVRKYASGVAPVFNLTIEHQPEYFANGILVHNCVWALTELMLGAKATPILAPIVIGAR